MLNVVNPPNNPVVRNNFIASGSASVLLQTKPKRLPIRKQPTILTANVPYIGVAKNLLDKIVAQNLKIAPIPPPRKIAIKFVPIILFCSKRKTVQEF